MKRTSASTARRPAPIRFTRGPVAAVLLFLAAVGISRAADVPSGRISVLAWDEPTASRLEPFHDDAGLLTTNQDLALLLFAEGVAPPPGIPGLIDLGSVEPTGDYYLMQVRDPETVEVLGSARVLYRRGHTVIVWSETTPQLIDVGAEELGRFRPLKRIDWLPKPWPPEDPEIARSPAPTDFPPEVGLIAQEVGALDYHSVWQALDDFETRYTFTAQNEAAAVWMHDLLESYGLSVEYFEHWQSGGFRKNVIATHPGTVTPDRVVYVTGHFDSVSEDPMNHAPGADDNASGTAAVLEAARVLSGHEFEHTIKFAAFNGEEQGLWGSQAYVAHIYGQSEDVLGCLNLDMIAYPGVDPAPPDLIIYTNASSGSLAQVLNDAAATFLPTELEPVVIVQTMQGSDHAAFWDYNYEAILGIEAEVWGPEFSPWYHTSADRIENYPVEFATHITQATVAAAAHLAVPVGAVSARGPLAVVGPRYLRPVFPNPGRDVTVVRLELPFPQDVKLSLHDVAGRRVRTLVSASLPGGRHDYRWDGFDDRGRPVGSGVYWIRLRTSERVEQVRLTRVR